MNRIRHTILCYLLLLTQTSIASEAIPDCDDLMRLGKNIESSLENGNPYYLNLKFNVTLILDSLFKQYNSVEYTDYNNGFREGMLYTFDLGDVLITRIQHANSFEFVSTTLYKGQPALVFRSMSELGIDYYLFNAKKHENNWILTDFYIFSTGTLLSETIESSYINNLNVRNNTRDNNIASTTRRVNKLVVKGNFTKAIKKWNQLPVEVKSSKKYLNQGIKIAEYTTEAEFNTVLNLFYKYYPAEPGKYLIPLNGLVLFNKYNEALATIDSLDRYLRTDPVLNIIRAQILYNMGNSVEVSYKLQSLLSKRPKFEMGYYSLLEFYLNEKQFQDATVLLDQMMLVFDRYKEAYIPILADHPEFLQSQAFLNWVNN